MTSMLYLHGALLLVRRYGIPYTPHMTKTLRNLTGQLLERDYLSEPRRHTERWRFDSEFLSMSLEAEVREDYYQRVADQDLWNDLMILQADGHIFPSRLPLGGEEEVGLRGLECPDKFVMAMAIDKMFIDWIMQQPRMHSEDWRRTKLPQVQELVRPFVKLLSNHHDNYDNFLPTKIRMNTFNSWSFSKVIYHPQIDWNCVVEYKGEGFDLTPPLSVGREYYSMVSRPHFPQDRTPTGTSDGGITAAPTATPRTIYPGGARFRERIEREASQPTAEQQCQRHAHLGEPYSKVDPDAYLREPVTRILDDHEKEKAEILMQIADNIPVKDHEKKIREIQALMDTKEKQLQEKFDKEKLELIADYSQTIHKLQKKLLSHQQVKYDLTALGTVQLLQARGIVISSCKRCLGLLVPCLHVRPVERDDRIVQESNDDVDIYPEVLVN